MVEVLQKRFAHFGLKYSIGGQISFDVFPVGWDKTFALRHIAGEHYDEVHFFGDKTFPGGNDYEIYTSDATIGHTVAGPDDTIAQCRAVLEGRTPAGTHASGDGATAAAAATATTAGAGTAAGAGGAKA